MSRFDFVRRIHEAASNKEAAHTSMNQGNNDKITRDSDKHQTKKKPSALVTIATVKAISNQGS